LKGVLRALHGDEFVLPKHPFVWISYFGREQRR
jgi:hypothetical protein